MAVLTSNQVCNICCIHYNAGLRCCALGSAVEGGRLFYKDGSIGWIVAPATTQVSRTWYARADAVTTAQAAVPCGDWFIPSRYDLFLSNTGRSFWDSLSSANYWSSTESFLSTAQAVHVENGTVGPNTGKNTLLCVRAFRRVLY